MIQNFYNSADAVYGSCLNNIEFDWKKKDLKK